MKRRLVNYDVFEKMRESSLSSAEHELEQAEPIVAQALSLPTARLSAFDKDTALYETVDGNFVRATYKINNDRVVFENIEQLVIDTDSEKEASKGILSEMFDALLENQEKKAEQLLSQYLALPVTRRVFSEAACKEEEKTEPFEKKKKGKKDKKEKDGKDVKNGKALPPFMKVKKEDMKEWANLCHNVFDYLRYIEYGPTLKESTAQHDERGNIVGLSIPTIRARNEAKLLSFDWDVPKTQLKMLRMKGEKLSEDTEFCKAIALLKRQNAVSDNDGLEEVLENIVSRWPQVLYLTQQELSETIKTALETVGASNFDDQTCDFMSEGILRTAHSAYIDRVKKILTLAGITECDSEDKYDCFKEVVSQFYPALDESNHLEMQVFVDLYESLRKVHELAQRDRNSVVVAETVHHLNELAAVIRQEIEPSIEIAEESVEWLSQIVETNLAGSDWSVSNKTHISLTGENPQMAKNARVGYTPASDFSPDWGDEAPVSDGKSYKGGLANKMRNSSWGNLGGGDTYPNLKNPYVPKPYGDYVIKGEKSVEKDTATGQWSSGDTWPSLQNPYVPKAYHTPQGYKMNNGKEDDLVVDK